MAPRSQLRLRLTATYVAFIAILLGATGLLFRQHLKNEAELNARLTVDADFGAAVGFLHIDNRHPEWVYDRNDPDEVFTVERLRHVYQLTGPDGNVLEQSTVLQSIRSATQTPGQPDYNPQYSIMRDQSGIPYSIRASWIRDDQSRRYGLTIGRSLAIPYRTVDRFVNVYLLVSLLMLVLASLFSWWLTGIAMRRSEV
jgi:hypothetical protein